MLFEKVKEILLQPKAAWLKIKREPTSALQVLITYAMPLALLPVVFGMLGLSMIGHRYGFGPVGGIFRIPITYSLIWAIVSYVLTLVGLFIEGLVINALAPSFGSKKHLTNAFKLAVYAYTPAFIAGILSIIPALSVLVFLLSLYGIYLLFLGFPVMMETPDDKVLLYLIVTIIVIIVIFAIISAVSGAILSALWSPVLF